MSDDSTLPENLLTQLFGALQGEMGAKLATAAVLKHPDAKGDQAELNWEQLLSDHLPRRYLLIAKAKVVDHLGQESQEQDLLIVDRQYSPFVFHAAARTYVPAESVYAAIECKQSLGRSNVNYAAQKVASVRQLQRTSAPVVHAGGRFAAREPNRILGGLLTTRSSWADGLGEAFKQSLQDQEQNSRLDFGCTLSEGAWTARYGEAEPMELTASSTDHSLMYLLLTLLADLQAIGTVTAMDFTQWRQRINTRTL